MAYRKHAVSKAARRSHHKREAKRRKALRASGGQIDPFGYVDTRGATKKRLRIFSISKGARDGAVAPVPVEDPTT